jgi:cysteine desulfurase
MFFAKNLQRVGSLIKPTKQYSTTKTVIKPSDLSKETHRSIYFDFQATTPLDFRVLDSMMPYFTTDFGNPHSRTHEYGWSTEYGVEKAREEIAKLINV